MNVEQMLELVAIMRAKEAIHEILRLTLKSKINPLAVYAMVMQEASIVRQMIECYGLTSTDLDQIDQAIHDMTIRETANRDDKDELKEIMKKIPADFRQNLRKQFNAMMQEWNAKHPSKGVTQ